MPELPDVEGFRRFFHRHAVGKPILGVWADHSMLRNTSPTRLRRSLVGRRFEPPWRHGKYLVCPTDAPVLVLHFGMTGGLEWLEREEGHRHDRLILRFPGGELHFRDVRKLGGIWLARNEGELFEVLGPLGPDALAVDRDEFERRLASRRGCLKSALMDQTFLAGLGNLTVDATLWRARLHPRRLVSSLTEGERAALFREMKEVLHRSIPHGFVPPSDVLLVTRRHPGGTCPRCGTRLLRSTVAGRTTWHCPRCQR